MRLEGHVRRKKDIASPVMRRKRTPPDSARMILTPAYYHPSSILHEDSQGVSFPFSLSVYFSHLPPPSFSATSNRYRILRVFESAANTLNFQVFRVLMFYFFSRHREKNFCAINRASINFSIVINSILRYGTTNFQRSVRTGSFSTFNRNIA